MSEIRFVDVCNNHIKMLGTDNTLDLDIVYLYFANRSNEESWKTAIAQFHLTGENSIHYNLPDKQQSALERYISVGGYPTYKIVAPNGNILPTEAPRPDHPEAIRLMMEKLKDNK